tara:strand:+ start:341 stop:1723 length:1383 start_codon:yes stop_codon:yes gene_type:complete
VGLDAGPVPSCSSADIAAWTARHRAPTLVEDVRSCEETSCTVNACDLGGCLAEVAGLVECLDCARAEGLCGMQQCGSACRLGTEGECRRCLCDAGCVGTFETCAGASTGLCDADPDPTPPEDTVALPLLVRRKSLTGFTRSRLFVADAPTVGEERSGYAAAGWTDFVPLTVAGKDYLFEVMDRCSGARCPVRLSPALPDGQLGSVPPWRDRWSRGWDTFSSFAVGPTTFLVAYKSGQRPPIDEARGTGRIVAFRATDSGLEISDHTDEAWPARLRIPPWTHISGFALDAAPFLVFHRSTAPHDTAVASIELDPEGRPTLVHRADLDWPRSWDVLESFPVALDGEVRWLLLGYRRSTGDEAAAMEIRAWTTSDFGTPTTGPALVAEEWPTDLLGVSAFRSGSATYLLRQERSGTAVILRFAPTLAQWIRGEPYEEVARFEWGTRPGWDVVGVARARLWNEP